MNRLHHFLRAFFFYLQQLSSSTSALKGKVHLYPSINLPPYQRGSCDISQQPYSHNPQTWRTVYLRVCTNVEGGEGLRVLLTVPCPTIMAVVLFIQKKKKTKNIAHCFVGFEKSVSCLKTTGRPPRFARLCSALIGYTRKWAFLVSILNHKPYRSLYRRFRYGSAVCRALSRTPQHGPEGYLPTNTFFILL